MYGIKGMQMLILEYTILNLVLLNADTYCSINTPA